MARIIKDDSNTLETLVDGVCYGRDDLLDVADKMAYEFLEQVYGEDYDFDSDVEDYGMELCGVMADAAKNFLKKFNY